jgi:hypothetical protein
MVTFSFTKAEGAELYHHDSVVKELVEAARSFLYKTDKQLLIPAQEYLEAKARLKAALAAAEGE